MKLMEKLKLLFKIKKPAGDLIDAVQEAKKTKKWIHFTVTVIGILITTAGALTGYIPPQTQLIITTILQALYNIIRGADKADNETVKGTFRTTEFWMTGLTEIQKLIVVSQDNMFGINPEWLAMSSTLIGMALAFGQNLAARAPIKTDPVVEIKEK
jgi:hypothetical protein